MSDGVLSWIPPAYKPFLSYSCNNSSGWRHKVYYLNDLGLSHLYPVASFKQRIRHRRARKPILKHKLCPCTIVNLWLIHFLAPNFPVPLLQNNISPSVEVKNLGVTFDSDNSFDNHVAKVCRACYYHLRDLRRIRKFLSDETAILLTNAMVSSRLDYCNSLLYGVSKSNIAKLQRVQNALCRIIFRLDKMSHVTPF